MKRGTTLLNLLAVVLAVPSIANAAESYQCRIEKEQIFGLSGNRGDVQVKYPNLEYAIQFDGRRFYWSPVHGDILETFDIKENSDTKLVGMRDFHAVGSGYRTLALDKRRGTVNVTARRHSGGIAQVMTGKCSPR